MAAPGNATAADNRPPSQPVPAGLLTGIAPCAAADTRPYVGGPPVLHAVLHDPDENRPAAGEKLTAEFEAWWRDADGQEQRRTFTIPTPMSAPAQHRWTLPSDLPPDTVISWRVRAHDAESTSPWSSDGGGSACEFVLDDVSPARPTVTSPDYAEHGERSTRSAPGPAR